MSIATLLELSAVIIRHQGGAAAPSLLTLNGNALPAGDFDPSRDRTLERGLRRWVEAMSGLRLGYVEQLYTFGDGLRQQSSIAGAPHVVSVGYLALTRDAVASHGHWQGWYDFFPWEDHRQGPPPMIAQDILPALEAWAGLEASGKRRARIRRLFAEWDEERVLDRYELLFEAGLVREAGAATGFGQPMQADHRRILATALSRLRGKLKYRPVLFELMAPAFTLTELQETAEAISGIALHKQNFRRMVEASGLIEPTGTQSLRRGGRPAAEFRYRRDALSDRADSTVRFGGARRG